MSLAPGSFSTACSCDSIDIDDLFAEEQDGVKAEPISPSTKTRVKDEPASQADEKPDINATPRPKPKKGRLVSNENPLDDFNRLIEGEGDVFRKAIQDLGLVVKENVESSFSRQAFPLAIDCLKAMRQTSLTYEEVETYNALVSRKPIAAESVSADANKIFRRS